MYLHSGMILLPTLVSSGCKKDIEISEPLVIHMLYTIALVRAAREVALTNALQGAEHYK